MIPMKTTQRILALLLMLALAGPAAAGEAEVRAAFGVTSANALDKLIPALYPGARLQWSPSFEIVMADGSRKALRVPATLYRDQQSGGRTFIVALEFPGNEEAVATALDAMQPVSQVSRAELAAFKLNGQGALEGAVKRAVIPDPSPLTHVVALDEGIDFPDAVWPSVQLTYLATYAATNEWVGQVEWHADFSTDSMTIRHRVPGFVAKIASDGASVSDLRAFIVPVSDTTLDIYSPAQKRFIMSCAIPCLPDGKVLLGLWGPTSRVAVGVQP